MSVCECVSVVCQCVSVSVCVRCVSVSVCECVSVSVCQCVSVPVCQCVVHTNKRKMTTAIIIAMRHKLQCATACRTRESRTFKSFFSVGGFVFDNIHNGPSPSPISIAISIAITITITIRKFIDRWPHHFFVIAHE